MNNEQIKHLDELQDFMRRSSQAFCEESSQHNHDVYRADFKLFYKYYNQYTKGDKK